MSGTLCRCMTYYRIQAAIKRAAAARRAESAEPGAAMEVRA
jgi:aerobic-type carbon monoxide dehydrogenase small subunit (CoxS/CutS family)